LIHTKRKACRGCNQTTNLHRFLQLGNQPLANAFLKGPEYFSTEKKYPLDVYFCETCSLVQLLDVIDPSVLFSNYIYVTGTSETIAEHNKNYANTVIRQMDIKDGLVIEVASNDGSLLKCFQAQGVKTLGIEPASNIAKIANEAGIETINDFFNYNTSQSVRETHGAADIVIGNNVMAHVDETQDFLRGAKHLLKPNGLTIIEVPYLGEFIERLEYDTVYHEHLCYFSITALITLCDAVGLVIRRIDHVPVHGGSIRVYAGPIEYYKNHSKSVMEEVAEEERAGLTQLKRYSDFAKDVEINKKQLLDLLNKLIRQGKSIAAYAAPAKGNTLLNYCGIDSSLIPYTVDKNSLKLDLYTPGMHLPVLPVETILKQQPDYVLILAWNFADEIIKQQNEYKSRGGQFIIPLPTPTII
jgi:SAM-dependent methyltransferase